MSELSGKYKIYKDIWKTVRAYNGTGPRATEYANNVVQFTAMRRRFRRRPTAQSPAGAPSLFGVIALIATKKAVGDIP